MYTLLLVIDYGEAKLERTESQHSKKTLAGHISSFSKKAKKEIGPRISKNFVTSEPAGKRQMKKKSSSSSGPPPPLPFGERNILRARVNILEKLANG